MQYPDGNILRIITVLYSCEVDGLNDLVFSDESIDLQFFAIDEICKMDIVETHKHIVDEYILKKI